MAGGGAKARVQDLMDEICPLTWGSLELNMIQPDRIVAPAMLTQRGAFAASASRKVGMSEEFFAL